MDTSPNRSLPYILPSQAQKNVTHYEAVRALDSIVQFSIGSRAVQEPPATPEEGLRHIVPSGASGVWARHDGEVAAFLDGGWLYHVPRAGWIAHIADEEAIVVHDGAAWTSLADLVITSISVLQNLAALGVNATADAANPSTVAGDGILLTHGGSDHRAKVNKAGAPQTASLLFQSDWTGRGEIGLAGSHDLAVKTSADGSQWKTAMQPDAASGRVSFPQNALPDFHELNLLPDGGRLAGNPEPSGLIASAFSVPTVLTAYNGAVFAEGGKYRHNNSTFGGSGSALDAEMQALMMKMKGDDLSRRYGPEFYLLKITAGAGTQSPNTTGGVTRYPLFLNRATVIGAHNTRGLLLRVTSGSVLAPYLPDQHALYVDGVLQAANAVVTAASGWVQVIWVDARSPETMWDYDQLMFRIYCEPASELLIALPLVIPALCPPRPGFLKGRIPGPQAWR